MSESFANCGARETRAQRTPASTDRGKPTALSVYDARRSQVCRYQPVTMTGTDALVRVPFPSLPLRWSPQHSALADNAHPRVPSAEIATALVRLVTVTGVDDVVVVPFSN